MESQWSSSGKYSQGSLHWASSKRFKKNMIELQCEPEQFEGRIIFMSLYNDSKWRKRVNTEKCETNSVTVANNARRFLLGRWSFLGPGSEKNWYGTYSDKSDGIWDKTAERMRLNFAESSHPVFRATSALERGELRSKGKGKKPLNWFFAWLFLLIISVSTEQLQIYAKNYPKIQRLRRKLQRMTIWNPWKIPTGLPVADPLHQRGDAGKPAAILWTNSNNFRKTRTFLHYTLWRRRTRWNEEESMSRVYGTSKRRSIPSETVDSRKHENRPGLGCEGLPSSKTLRYRNHGQIPVSWQNSFLGSNCEWNWQVRDRNVRNRFSHENVEHRVTGKPVAKAKSRPMPTMTPSPISILVRERKWIDINPERFRQDCFTVSKAIIRLLRHDPSIPREDDGAVRFDDIMDKSKAKFDGTSQWSINDLMTSLASGGGPKKRFQHCLNPNSSKHFLYFRAIQGHSGGNFVDPAMCKTMYGYPEDFSEYICHVGNVSEIHSRDRQSVFFTAVNPVDDDPSVEKFDST